MNRSQPSHEMIPPREGKMTSEVQAVLVFLVLINIVTFPFAAILNMLVIMAVKIKSRLRAHKSNILLACLATTDLLVGVIVQPMFAALMLTFVLGETTTGSFVLQSLTLMLKTVLCDNSLIHLAIKHTYAYHNRLVTDALLPIGSALAWLFPLILYVSLFVGNFIVFIVIDNTCIGLFIAVMISCQITAYREIRRHEKEFSVQQAGVTEEARQKFLKDKKSLKLTVTIVSLLFLCYIPVIVFRAVKMSF